MPGIADSEKDLERFFGTGAIPVPETDLGQKNASSTEPPPFDWGAQVGDDLKKALLAPLAQISPTGCKVVIYGESGVGKEIVANAIHKNSLRRDRPFVAFNCSAVPDTLIESELFGSEKGSFTGAYKNRPGKFEAADSGTLFLDEIADMSLTTQVKVLRAVETGEIPRIGSEATHRVDIRVIVATNRDLPRLVKEGKFREDLFWRLGKVEIRVPPLRERPADTIVLANHFLRSLKFKKKATRLSITAEEALCKYLWPGNVRELAAVIEAAAVFAKGPELTAEDVGEQFHVNTSPRLNVGTVEFLNPDGKVMSWNECHRSYLAYVMEVAGGMKTRASDLSGMSKGAIHARLRRYGLSGLVD